MGLQYGSYKLLMKSREYIFSEMEDSMKCLMFGRAKMSLSKSQMSIASLENDIPINILAGWADNFLKKYGFDSVQSLDYSDFEGADYVWNLNRQYDLNNSSTLPLGFDFVMDYGTSEHIFNPPVSFLNAFHSLKNGGLFNCVLPVTGWCDHGFYQFSPSFFYALNSEKLTLVKLYFFDADPSVNQLKYWDGLSFDFMEHVHGAFDGSFAANCLQYLNKPILAWALFKKNMDIPHAEFLHNTQQLIYKKQWADNSEFEELNEKKLDLYKNGLLSGDYFVKYINQIANYI